MAVTSSFTDSAGGGPLLNPNRGDAVWAGLAALSPADPGGNVPASLLTPGPENPHSLGMTARGLGTSCVASKGNSEAAGPRTPVGTPGQRQGAGPWEGVCPLQPGLSQAVQSQPLPREEESSPRGEESLTPVSGCSPGRGQEMLPGFSGVSGSPRRGTARATHMKPIRSQQASPPRPCSPGCSGRGVIKACAAAGPGLQPGF